MDIFLKRTRLKTKAFLMSCFTILVLSQLSFAKPMEYVIDDFNQLKNWEAFAEGSPAKSAEFKISTEWASHGTSSLRINAPAYEMGVSTPWPGIVLRGGKLPVRDWRPYNYLCIDFKITQPNTELMFLVQRGARHQRVSPIKSFNPGEYRIWINIPDYISGGHIEDVAQMNNLEISVYRPKENKTVYIDNIRLTGSFEPMKHAFNFLGINQADIDSAELALQVPTEQAPKMTFVERIGQDQQTKQIHAANELKKIKMRSAALDQVAQMQQRLAQDYPGKNLGAYVVPAYERVHFYAQAPTVHWKKQAQMVMGRGDTRAFQFCLAREANTEFSGVKVNVTDLAHTESGAKISSNNFTLNVVGYINLPASAQHPNLSPGWYADPVLPWKNEIALNGERLLQPLLITVKIPDEQLPGRYTGKIRVSFSEGDKAELIEIPIEIEVVSYQYPAQSTLKTLIATGPYGNIDPDFFLDYRLSPNNNRLGSIYLRGNAPGVNMAQVDEYLKKGMTSFNLHQVWEAEFQKLEKEHGLKGATDIFMSRLERHYPLSQWDELKRKGIAEHALVYGFDEVSLAYPAERERIRSVFQAVKDKYGKYGVKVATTAQPFKEEYLDLPVDIWIPTFGRYDRALAEKARQRGQEVWVYMIGWEIWQPLAWSQAVPWATFQLGAPGWLYYNFSGWPDANNRALGDNPLTKWDAVSYEAQGAYGTGGLVYKDAANKLLPSLRLVNFREGMLDHDLLKAVQQLAQSDSPQKEAARALLARSQSELVIDYVKDHNMQNSPLSMEMGEANFIGASFEKWRYEALKLLGKAYPAS